MHGNKGKKQSLEHKQKINTPERAKKISETLKLKYKTGQKVCWTKGKKLTEKHKNKIKISARRGKDNHSWSGNNPTYSASHLWIKNYYGKANECENRENNILNFKCSKKSNIFQWARIKGHRYSRNIKDYYKLCASCHSKYDSKPSNRKCSIKRCNGKHKGYGYCDKHYQRFKKWGNPLAVKTHHNPIKLIK